MEVKPNAMGVRNREHPTKLTNEQFESCWKVAKEFLSKNIMIRNQQLREITGMGYDQAISFFNRAIAEQCLLRKCASSSTHYELKD